MYPFKKIREQPKEQMDNRYIAKDSYWHNFILCW